jgi:hypothetical protein
MASDIKALTEKVRNAPNITSNVVHPSTSKQDRSRGNNDRKNPSMPSGDNEGSENDDDERASDASDGNVSVVDAVDDYLDSGEEQENNTQSEDEDDDEDPIDELVDQLGNNEDVGPALPENLAVLLTKLMKTTVPTERHKTMFKEIKTQKNVPMLKCPRVNAEIWSNLNQNSQKQDFRLAVTQTKIAKMLTLSAELTAGLTELRLKLKGEEMKSAKVLAKTALEIT